MGYKLALDKTPFLFARYFICRYLTLISEAIDRGFGFAQNLTGFGDTDKSGVGLRVVSLGGCLTTKVRQSLFYTQNQTIQAAFAPPDIIFGQKFK